MSFQNCFSFCRISLAAAMSEAQRHLLLASAWTILDAAQGLLASAGELASAAVPVCFGHQYSMYAYVALLFNQAETIHSIIISIGVYNQDTIALQSRIRVFRSRLRGIDNRQPCQEEEETVMSVTAGENHASDLFRPLETFNEYLMDAYSILEVRPSVPNYRGNPLQQMMRVLITMRDDSHGESRALACRNIVAWQLLVHSGLKNDTMARARTLCEEMIKQEAAELTKAQADTLLSRIMNAARKLLELVDPVRTQLLLGTTERPGKKKLSAVKRDRLRHILEEGKPALGRTLPAVHAKGPERSRSEEHKRGVAWQKL